MRRIAFGQIGLDQMDLVTIKSALVRPTVSDLLSGEIAKFASPLGCFNRMPLEETIESVPESDPKPCRACLH